MIYAITGTDPDFLGFALFNQFDEVDIDLVSATSTTAVLNNPSTGAVTTLTGSGFTFSGDFPTGGTITGISVDDGGDTIGSLSDFSWSLVDFGNALDALDNDNDSPIADLFNDAGPLTVDASGATGFIDAESGLEGILELLDDGFTYIDSPFDESVGGTDFDDTYVIGVQNSPTSIDIEATQGDDTFDLTGVDDNAFVFLDYDQDYSTPRAITVNINATNSNTGTISTSDFTDTILGLDAILTSEEGGLGIGGSTLNDTFNVTLGIDDGDKFHWTTITGAEGSDAYNITLGDNSTVRLDFRFGAYNDPFTGLVANFETGVIGNDGFGNTESFNLTNTGGRLEVRGTFMDDDIIGSEFRDSFILLTGNDTVDGGDGFDRVRYDRNGVEAVTVNLATGEATGTWNGEAFTHDLTSIEWVRGSREGDDTITGSGNDERLDGRGGDDSLVGGSGDDTLDGGEGNDIFLSGSGNDQAFGGSGNDTVYGGSGNDYLSASSGFNEMFGGVGNDSIDGGSDADELGGGGGNDVLYGFGGDDTLWGSSGNDAIYGGEEDDFVGAGANKDRVYGENGDDTIYGGGGKDTVDGGNGDDLVAGGAGTDRVIAGSGDDTLWGQAGADTLLGGTGDDDMSGGAQGDVLQGQQGDDTLNGGFGNDTLLGGADDDVLNGNFGNDVLIGGLGADTFIMDDSGAKTVTDFDGTEGDMLHIDNALFGGANLSAAQVISQFADDSSGTVIFDFGGGATLTLDGVSSTAGLADDLLVI